MAGMWPDKTSEITTYEDELGYLGYGTFEFLNITFHYF